MCVYNLEIRHERGVYLLKSVGSAQKVWVILREGSTYLYNACTGKGMPRFSLNMKDSLLTKIRRTIYLNVLISTHNLLHVIDIWPKY